MALKVWCGLTLGNFIWQAMSRHDWMLAAERSFFQAIALLALALLTAAASHEAS